MKKLLLTVALGMLYTACEKESMDEISPTPKTKTEEPAPEPVITTHISTDNQTSSEEAESIDVNDDGDLLDLITRTLTITRTYTDGQYTSTDENYTDWAVSENIDPGFAITPPDGNGGIVGTVGDFFTVRLYRNNPDSENIYAVVETSNVEFVKEGDIIYGYRRNSLMNATSDNGDGASDVMLLTVDRVYQGKLGIPSRQMYASWHFADLVGDRLIPNGKAITTIDGVMYYPYQQDPQYLVEPEIFEGDLLGGAREVKEPTVVETMTYRRKSNRWRAHALVNIPEGAKIMRFCAQIKTTNVLGEAVWLGLENTPGYSSLTSSNYYIDVYFGERYDTDFFLNNEFRIIALVGEDVIWTQEVSFD